MKVLITGSTGQIGQALLASKPVSVEAVATTRADLDLANHASVRDAVLRHQPDLIVNAAAYTAVDLAEAEPEQARQVNALGAEHLASSAASNGIRMIQLSTDFVFDGNASAAYLPDAATNPLSVYGETKWSGEQAVLGRLPERSIVLRTSWVYSATGRNFLLTILRRLREHRSVSVVNDQTGAPTTADSVATIVWALAARPDSYGLFHWTDSGAASWYEFALAIAEEASALGLVDRSVEVVPIATEDYPTAARRPRFSLLDTRSTTALTGIVPGNWRDRLRGVLKEVVLD